MWYQLTIEATATKVNELVAFLEANEALSISLMDKNDDAILEAADENTDLWPETIIESLFDQLAKAEKIQTLLENRFGLSTKIVTLQECDWQNSWTAFAKPLCFGNKLWIYPSFIDPPDNALFIRLDPGLAFGTGSHPTTALCLNWLTSAAVKQRTVIDYGCGSGILSLAALKLGASQVQAVDIDAQALTATAANAAANGLTQGLTVDFPTSVQPSDIILANILLNPLLDLKHAFKSHLLSSGILVTTGILIEQQDHLIRDYAEDFELTATFHLEEWSLLVWALK